MCMEYMHMIIARMSMEIVNESSEWIPRKLKQHPTLQWWNEWEMIYSLLLHMCWCACKTPSDAASSMGLLHTNMNRLYVITATYTNVSDAHRFALTHQQFVQCIVNCACVRQCVSGQQIFFVFLIV